VTLRAGDVIRVSYGERWYVRAWQWSLWRLRLRGEPLWHQRRIVRCVEGHTVTINSAFQDQPRIVRLD
jgi:hypothetical protein